MLTLPQSVNLFVRGWLSAAIVLAVAGSAGIVARPALAQQGSTNPCTTVQVTSPPATQQYRIEQTLSQMITPINNYMVISAHRGYWRDAPENSLPAFWAAAALGVDAVEIDVSATSDNVPVLMHDTDISRTTNGTGSINSINSEAFLALNVRDRNGCLTQYQTTNFANLLSQLYIEKQVALNPNTGDLTGTAIIVDIKDRRGLKQMYTTLLAAIQAYKRTWYSGQSNLARPAVIFKVRLAAMPPGSSGPAQFASDVAAPNPTDPYIPSMIYVKYPDDPLATPTTAPPASADQVPSADPTFVAYLKDSHTLHFETNEKYLGDPMTAYRQYLQNFQRSIAGYGPENFFPEGEPHSGKCCQTENTNYPEGSGSGQSLPQPGCFSTAPYCLDLTGRWDFLLSTGMNVLTTERADDALNWAKALGRRNNGPATSQQPEPVDDSSTITVLEE